MHSHKNKPTQKTTKAAREPAPRQAQARRGKTAFKLLAPNAMKTVHYETNFSDEMESQAHAIATALLRIFKDNNQGSAFNPASAQLEVEKKLLAPNTMKNCAL
jgi:hypothetical protein